MKKDDLKVYQDKRIKILLLGNYVFSGHILEIFDDHLTFQDKFGNLISIKLDQIGTIFELNEEWGK